MEHVEETMRPLPIESIPGAPGYVRGASILRGRPTPIVDLRCLLGGEAGGPAGRLVSVKVGNGRRVGLLVDGVIGIRDEPDESIDELPPLLQDAAGEKVQSLARLDSALLTVLKAGRLVPEEVWTERVKAPEAS
jgi:purine-binding chemotaxis protein CheW